MAFALSRQRTLPWGAPSPPLIQASPILPAPPPAHLATAAWVSLQRSIAAMSSMPGSSPMGSAVPWRTAQPTPPPPPPGPAPPPQPKARDLVGYTALLWERTRRGRTERTLGLVTEVIGTTETGQGHPLLRVVAPPDPGDGPTAVAAEHLIPLVRSIVPRVDPGARRLLVEPPDGLLELGRRRALLARLRAELTSFLDSEREGSSSEGPQNSRPPAMPRRRELVAAGRRDLVRLIAAAGGFVEVAQELGFEASRRPPGYWEDEEALDRELTLFVAANWVRFEEGPAEELAAAAFVAPDDAFAAPNADYDSSGSSGSSGEEEEGVEGWGAGSEEGGWGPGAVSSSSLNPAPPRDREIYWYNQVTRSMRWTQPVLPQALELDDQGSLLLTDSAEDRAMPSRSALFAAGRFDLHHAIVGAGGYGAVAEALDRFPAWPPTRRLRSLRTLAGELRETGGDLGLPRGRMPTRTQLTALGREDLHLAVMRAGGYPAVAEKLRWKSQRKRRGAWEDLGAVAAEFAAFAAARGGGGGGDPLRLPTHEELRRAGRHDLRHALQRHGSAAVAEAAGLKARRAGVGRGRARQAWLEGEAAAAREAAASEGGAETGGVTDSN